MAKTTLTFKFQEGQMSITFDDSKTVRDTAKQLDTIRELLQHYCLPVQKMKTVHETLEKILQNGPIDLQNR